MAGDGASGHRHVHPGTENQVFLVLPLCLKGTWMNGEGCLLGGGGAHMYRCTHGYACVQKQQDNFSLKRCSSGAIHLFKQQTKKNKVFSWPGARNLPVCIPSTEITRVTPRSNLFIWAPGIKLRSLELKGKHFTHWVTPCQPQEFLFYGIFCAN